MASTFIAVQCFQCLTMQVKMKNRSNKWSCVVCNEKQSVRKVYAHSSMAKDVRKFVQSFNMSRKSVDHQNLTQDIPLNSKRKTMTDWTAYLDSEDRDDEAEASERDINWPKIVTELPTVMFKKASFSKRITKAAAAKNSSQGTCYWIHQINRIQNLIVMINFVKCGLESSNNDDGRRQGKGVASTEDSRWTAYLTTHEEQLIDGCLNTLQRNYSAADAFNTPPYHDQQFEEDIHPDFK
ncbi:unnamed protein product [Rhodiola kirilowii]